MGSPQPGKPFLRPARAPERRPPAGIQPMRSCVPPTPHCPERCHAKKLVFALRRGQLSRDGGSYRLPPCKVKEKHHGSCGSRGRTSSDLRTCPPPKVVDSTSPRFLPRDDSCTFLHRSSFEPWRAGSCKDLETGILGMVQTGVTTSAWARGAKRGHDLNARSGLRSGRGCAAFRIVSPVLRAV